MKKILLLIMLVLLLLPLSVQAQGEEVRSINILLDNAEDDLAAGNIAGAHTQIRIANALLNVDFLTKCPVAADARGLFVESVNTSDTARILELITEARYRYRAM